MGNDQQAKLISARLRVAAVQTVVAVRWFAADGSSSPKEARGWKQDGSRSRSGEAEKVVAGRGSLMGSPVSWRDPVGRDGSGSRHEEKWHGLQ
jgi:hypothetical protein